MVLKIALTCLVLAALAFGVENAKKKTDISIEEPSERFQCTKDGIMDLSIVRKEIMAHIEGLYADLVGSRLGQLDRILIHLGLGSGL